MASKRLILISTSFLDKIPIFVFPILLTFLNGNWIFSPATRFLPDPWFYLGYFRYFYEYAPTFPSNVHYFVERISWNVPGYYLYRTLAPLQANYVLHLLVCYIALFSLYGTLHMLFNRRTALTTTLLMSGYPWFLRAVGWDYVDGIGIAQMLLMIFLLTIARDSRYWKFLLFLAGTVHASLLITNLFWVGFAPSWAIYFVMINRPISKDSFLKLIGAASYFLLGNLVLVFFITVFYYSVTGNYFFLQNSLGFSAQQSHNENLIRFISTFYGTMPPYWHVLAALVAIVSIVRMLDHTRNIYRHPLMAVVALFITAYGWLIFWHYYALPYLIVFLYSSFTIPAIFILLGALLADTVDELSNVMFGIIVFAIILSLASIFYLIVIFPSLVGLEGNVVLLFIFSLVFVSMMLMRHRTMSMLPILLSLGTLFFLTASNSYVLLADPKQNQNNFMAIIECSDAIDAYYPNYQYKDFRLWFREDINYNTFFSLSALYLYPWGSAIDHPVSGKTPSAALSLWKTDEFHDGDSIVIVSSIAQANDIVAEANRALAERHATVRLESEKEIRKGSLHFTLYFAKINLIDND